MDIINFFSPRLTTFICLCLFIGLVYLMRISYLRLKLHWLNCWNATNKNYRFVNVCRLLFNMGGNKVFGIIIFNFGFVITSKKLKRFADE